MSGFERGQGIKGKLNSQKKQIKSKEKHAGERKPKKVKREAGKRSPSSDGAERLKLGGKGNKARKR